MCNGITSLYLISCFLPSFFSTDTIAVNPWKLNQKYADQTAKVGDIIAFTWTGNHGVFKIPSGTCPDTFTPSATNGIQEIQTAKVNGTAAYTFSAAGTYWFAW